MCAVVSLLFVAGMAEALTVTVEPDVWGSGSNISTVYAGVTLSSVGPYISDPSLNGLVYSWTAINPDFASTGTRVFGNNLYSSDAAGSPTCEIWYRSPDGSSVYRLRADFDELADYVAIDIIGNSATDAGVLEAYDSSDTLLTSITTPPLTSGAIYTAMVDRPSFDIAYIIASGTGGETVYLDNLSANVVPEPRLRCQGLVR